MEKFKDLMVQIFCTKVGWLAVCMVGTVLFGTLTNWYDWAVYPMFACLAYCVGLGLVMMAFAWIINPIRKMRGKGE